MRLAEIHERTHLPLTRLRYVLDNKVVSGLQHASEGRGTARDFSLGESMLIAMAAALFESGVDAPFVRLFISRIVRDKSVENITVLPSEDEVQIVQVAEQVYARLLTDLHPPGSSVPWGDTRTKALLDLSYQPVAYMSVDMAELRRRMLRP